MVLQTPFTESEFIFKKIYQITGRDFCRSQEFTLIFFLVYICLRRIKEQNDINRNDLVQVLRGTNYMKPSHRSPCVS